MVSFVCEAITTSSSFVPMTFEASRPVTKRLDFTVEIGVRISAESHPQGSNGNACIGRFIFIVFSRNRTDAYGWLFNYRGLPNLQTVKYC